jgi:protein-glutamine gamma-glutamyltransferase
MEMKPRLFLIAGALVFWGLQTGFVWVALVLAAIVVAPSVVKHQLSFTDREFARLWDVTLLVLVGAAVYQRQTGSASGSVLSFLQWLPMLLFPMTAAFLLSQAERLPYSTFVFWWRRHEKSEQRMLDITYGYFGICLLSASAGSGAARGTWFYPVSTVLIAAALWANRPRRLGAVTTLALLMAVAGAGYLLQGKWRDLQAEFESKTVSWFAGFFPRPFEDQESYTSFGEVAQLKNSGRLLMRLEVAPGSAPPRLLRQVSFDQYRRGAWLSTRRSYEPVEEASPGTWTLSESESPGATNRVTLSMLVPEGRVLLPVPAGAARARDLTAARLERNRFGNVRVWDCGDPLECVIDFDGSYSYEPPPSAKDLQVPGPDVAAVEEVVRELGLKTLPVGTMLQKVAGFFTDHFRYETQFADEEQSATNASFVAPFLRETRAGHCEYFATSAALILRRAGIPTRYALGFAAVEPVDGDRTTYRIRERHCHAWVLAYIDGRWTDFDPTPGTWAAIEEQQSSVWGRIADLWANVKFKVATTRLVPELGSGLALSLAVPAIAFVAWRFWKRRKTVRRKHAVASLSRAYAWPGLDSELFEIERSLGDRGLNRTPGETSVAWLSRVASRCPASDRLAELVTLHYKYRFDPAGLTMEERHYLSEGARSWLSHEATAGTM